MRITEVFDRQKASLILSLSLMLVAVLSGVSPALVSAATVTERSIELSSAIISATDVTYNVNFKSVASAGAFVIDFCGDTPVIGQACSTPTSFDASSASSATSGFTDVSDIDANTIVVAGTIGADSDISVEIEGIDNPSVKGPVYARILTYTAKAGAEGYTSANPAVVAAPLDSGSVVISITDGIGVSGAVLESLLFCVSAAAINEDCTGTTTPVLAIGETVGSNKVLVPTALSTGDVYTQVTTNASSGAVIRLKSNAIGCGGLLRAGADDKCDIEPALTGGIEIGEPKFGVKTAASTDTSGADASGVFQPVTGSGYNNDDYAMNFTALDAAGVTSLYGDPFLDTDGAPANNKNMKLTFGASVSNQTPAGTYSANISLIATGKF